jgi:hypothetical protein
MLGALCSLCDEDRLMEEEIRRKILTLLDQHRIMAVATLRPDGSPQATTAVNEGLTLYFLCGIVRRQKIWR